MREPTFESKSPLEQGQGAVARQATELAEVAKTPLQQALAEIIKAGSQEVLISEKN